MKIHLRRPRLPGILYSISGPSGVGKDTIIATLLTDPHNKLMKPVGYTTRSPRPHEKNGKDYYFISTTRLLKYLKNNKLATYSMFLGQHYGFAKKSIEKALRKGNNVLIDITADSVEMLKKSFPHVVTIFIKPPAPEIETLKTRLIGRNTESAENIAKRLMKAQEELAQASLFEHHIVNHQLEQTIQDFNKLMTQTKEQIKVFLRQ